VEIEGKSEQADPVAVAEMVAIYVTLGLLLLHRFAVLTGFDASLGTIRCLALSL